MCLPKLGKNKEEADKNAHRLIELSSIFLGFLIAVNVLAWDVMISSRQFDVEVRLEFFKLNETQRNELNRSQFDINDLNNISKIGIGNPSSGDIFSKYFRFPLLASNALFLATIILGLTYRVRGKLDSKLEKLFLITFGLSMFALIVTTSALLLPIIL